MIRLASPGQQFPFPRSYTPAVSLNKTPGANDSTVIWLNPQTGTRRIFEPQSWVAQLLLTLPASALDRVPILFSCCLGGCSSFAGPSGRWRQPICLLNGATHYRWTSYPWPTPQGRNLVESSPRSRISESCPRQDHQPMDQRTDLIPAWASGPGQFLTRTTRAIGPKYPAPPDTPPATPPIEVAPIVNRLCRRLPIGPRGYSSQS